MPVTNDILTAAVSDFSSIRNQVASGDMLLASGTYSFSKLIQIGTNSPWSHCALVVRMDSIGRIVVLESVEDSGIRAVSLGSYLSDYEGSGQPYDGKLVIARHAGINSRFDTDSTALPTVCKFAFDYLGHPYAKDDVADIAARIAAGAINTTIPGKITPKPGVYICSEFVDACFLSIQISLEWDRLGFIAPSDVAADPNVSGLWRIL